MTKSCMENRKSSNIRQKRWSTLLYLVITFLAISQNKSIAQVNSVQLVCPGDIVQNNDPGSCGAIVHYFVGNPGGANANLFYSRPSGSTFPVGTTTVNVNAYDNNGTELGSCSFNV